MWNEARDWSIVFFFFWELHENDESNSEWGLYREREKNNVVVVLIRGCNNLQEKNRATFTGQNEFLIVHSFVIE